MIHPSYKELIEVINKGQDLDEAPLVTSRYSVVLATSKRARQIISGAEPYVEGNIKKPVSIAVKELYEGDIHILKDEDEMEGAMKSDVIQQEKERQDEGNI
jgi:DNA-directed RNA polymerase subunit omega